MLKKSIHPIRKNVNPGVYSTRKYSRGQPEFTMSRGELKSFCECPEEWIAGVPREATDSMEHGSLVDCLLLTPDLYEMTYAVTPETYPATPKKKDDPIEQKPWTGSAKYCKEWEADIIAEGKTPIQPVALNSANCAIRKLKADSQISDLLENSDFQVMVSADWHDEETGLVVPIKCLIDIVPNGKSFLVDLKTAKSLNRREYARSVFDCWTFVQAAMYLDAYNISEDDNRNEFRHILSKNKSPWSTAKRYMEEEFITLGRATYQEALRDYCQCLKNSQWPGIDDWRPSRNSINGWDSIQCEPWMLLSDL